MASDSRRADCEAGLAEACHALGTDDAVEPDERLAFLVAACGLDHADACFAAAMQALNVGDLAKSKEHFDLGCIRGNALSCTLLGEAHFHGKQGALELPRSRSKARRYHLRAWELTQSACEHGDGGACVVVGIALTTGHTGHNEGSGVRVPKDESKGLEVWDHACLELGDADACRSIAFDLYRTGGTLSEKYRARACALGLHSLCE